MSKKTVYVYDTITKKYINVNVNDKVYEAYKRTNWGIENNNNSFYKHEIQYSMLIGGKDGAFENFHEFIIDGDITENNVMKKTIVKKLHSCLEMLSDSDYELIHKLYFEKMTERDCAAYYGINQKNIHKKKVRILATLHKLLEEN
jgi:DNA-directed RNA polymerase specialized sigma subunit